MRILAIESSCDETAAAVVEEGRRIVSSVVASQDAIHAPYGGVVPELASRRHLEVIVPVVEKALRAAGMHAPEVDALAVTQGPGLIGSLLVGCSMAKALAYAHRLPLVPVNHLEGHIYAAWLIEDRGERAPRLVEDQGERAPLPPMPPTGNPRRPGSEGSAGEAGARTMDVPRMEAPTPPEHPFLALIVSGGHTALYLATAPLTYTLVGETRDDAAGEAFDKVAKLLRLGFPGGPIIQRVAETGDPRAIPFPVAQMTDQAPDFSFSGLKTSVSLFVKRHRGLSDALVADVAASFQAAVVKMLVRKTVKAVLRTGVKRVVLTGGVAANGPLRAALAAEAVEHGFSLHVPPRHLCTDNAAMIGAAGTARFLAGTRAPLTMNAVADLGLAA